MTSVFATLFIASAMSLAALAVVLGRNRQGRANL
jgi:hypothetical protein